VVRAGRHVGRRPADTRLIVSAPVLTITEVRSGAAVPFRIHNKDRRRHAEDCVFFRLPFFERLQIDNLIFNLIRIGIRRGPRSCMWRAVRGAARAHNERTADYQLELVSDGRPCFPGFSRAGARRISRPCSCKLLLLTWKAPCRGHGRGGCSSKRPANASPFLCARRR
jgi:hypothetical protein